VRAGPEVSPCSHPLPVRVVLPKNRVNVCLACRGRGTTPADEPAPYVRNARTNSEDQGGGDHGVDPDLVDKAGGIIAGHGRVLAAQLLGLKEVPVVVRAGGVRSSGARI
jgi:hypothetical protein